MAERNHGPEPGSEGARKVSDAHKGSHTHDRAGGFAARPELAKEAGRKGGDSVMNKYGASFYSRIGKMGGETVKQTRGPEFYREIGRRGGKARGDLIRKRKAEEQEHIDR